MEAVHLEDLSIQRMFLGTLIVTQEYSWMLILIITGTEYSVNSFFITDEGKWCCQLFRMETFKIMLKLDSISGCDNISYSECPDSSL